MEVKWGVVSVASPLEVTFVGDTAATRVAMKQKGYTAAVNDKVMLVRVGAQWIAFPVETA